MSCNCSNYDYTVYRGSANGSIGVATTHKHSLKLNEVLLQITHSGICGTDAHFAAFMPRFLGHEGVGIVKEIGSDVWTLNVGDRAGFGYIKETCGTCEQCYAGMVFSGPIPLQFLTDH